MIYKTRMIEPFTRLPESGGSCMAGDIDPRDWDIVRPEPGTRAIVHFEEVLHQAMTVCGDCPVIRTCARRALELTESTTWLDVVIAGVPMVHKTVPGFERLPTVLDRALVRVALGDPLDVVHGQLRHTMAGFVELANVPRMGVAS